IKEVRDKNGYLDSLGKPRIAQVKRAADIAEAEALKETRIKKAQAEKASQAAELQRQTEIAESLKEKELKLAQYKQ
ncbi:flotillin family protein, partial [Enterococcus faecium]